MDSELSQRPDQVIHFPIFKKPLGQGDLNRRFRSNREGRQELQPNFVGLGTHYLCTVPGTGAIKKFNRIASGKTQNSYHVPRIGTQDFGFSDLDRFWINEKASRGHRCLSRANDSRWQPFIVCFQVLAL